MSSDITVRERNKACSPRVEIGRHDERVMKLPRVCNTGYIVERENNGGTDAFFAQGGEREVFEISLPRKLVHPLSSAFFIGRGEPLQEYFPGNFHPVISTFFFFFPSISSSAEIRFVPKFFFIIPDQEVIGYTGQKKKRKILSCKEIHLN